MKQTRSTREVTDPDAPALTSWANSLTMAQAARIIADFADAGRQALGAGYDGVEICCAHGFLLDQFLHAQSNQRSDELGGTPCRRARFPFEVVRAVAGTVGSSRVGVRISPLANLNGMMPDENRAYIRFLENLQFLGISFLHVSLKRERDRSLRQSARLVQRMTDRWNGQILYSEYAVF